MQAKVTFDSLNGCTYPRYPLYPRYPRLVDKLGARGIKGVTADSTRAQTSRLVAITAQL